MYKCNTSVSKMFMQVAGLFCLVLNQQILWIQRHLKVPIARFGFNSTLYYSSKFYLVYISMKNMKNKHFLGHKIEFHRWIHLAQQQPIQWTKLISSLRICTYHESFKLIKHNVFLVILSLKNVKFTCWIQVHITALLLIILRTILNMSCMKDQSW